MVYFSYKQHLKRVGRATIVIYRVSYIVGDDSSPGVIRSQDHPPQVGDVVQLYEMSFVIVDVAEIMPPKNDESFLIVTLELCQAAAK